MAEQENFQQRQRREYLQRSSDPFAAMKDAGETVVGCSAGDLHPDIVLRAIAVWTDAGYAITFGRTSDGGALGVHLLAGGKKKSKYSAHREELEEFLAGVKTP